MLYRKKGYILLKYIYVHVCILYITWTERKILTQYDFIHGFSRCVISKYVPTINTMHNEQRIVPVESRSNFFESYFVFPVSVVLQNFPVPTGNGLLQILKKMVIKIDKKEALVMDLVLL